MPPEEKKGRIPIKSLRTYQGDVEEAIGKNKYSSTTILVAEQKRKEERPEKVVSVRYSGTRNKIFIYLSVIFFILGVGSVIGIYYFRAHEKTIVEQATKTLLSFTKEDSIAVASSTRENLIIALTKEKEGFKQPVNSVLYVNTTDGTNPVQLSKIMSLVGPSAPSSLIRSFDSQYMIGVYSYDTNEIFFIIKVKDFASSYSGMLKWENDMPKDLQKIFSINPDLVSTTSPFSDLAVKNKDLRVLRSPSGKIELLYSFIDKETLLITKNDKIFNAIIGRFTVSKQAK
ncbi:MAG: hypothetical protein AB201_00145 [Parcubacteria bacterium C7867-006]|nr:MAG: hypothetical protein AB201_00145 [Parcubacteria bacterium C7867-006]